jgi:ankyrin repeat protein
MDTIKLLVEYGGLVTDGGLVAHASYAHNSGQPQRLEVVRFLLDHGASVDGLFMENANKEIPDGMAILMGRQTGLHCAIWGGKIDMISLLLDRGADMNLSTCSALKTNGQVISPAELARMTGHEDIATLLERRSDGAHTSSN